MAEICHPISYGIQRMMPDPMTLDFDKMKGNSFIAMLLASLS